MLWFFHQRLSCATHSSVCQSWWPHPFTPLMLSAHLSAPASSSTLLAFLKLCRVAEWPPCDGEPLERADQYIWGSLKPRRVESLWLVGKELVQPCAHRALPEFYKNWSWAGTVQVQVSCWPKVNAEERPLCGFRKCFRKCRTEMDMGVSAPSGRLQGAKERSHLQLLHHSHPMTPLLLSGLLFL